MRCHLFLENDLYNTGKWEKINLWNKEEQLSISLDRMLAWSSEYLDPLAQTRSHWSHLCIHEDFSRWKQRGRVSFWEYSCKWLLSPPKTSSSFCWIRCQEESRRRGRYFLVSFLGMKRLFEIEKEVTKNCFIPCRITWNRDGSIWFFEAFDFGP